MTHQTLSRFTDKLKSCFSQAIELGYSPIPLSSSRISLIPWKSYQTIQPTQQEWAEWFSEFNVYGVTFLMGNGVLHLECDTAESEIWIRQMGIPEGAPEWRSQRGAHWLFADPNQIGFNKTGIFQGIDVKGLGGTANMPPSTTDRMTLEPYYTWTSELIHKNDLPAMPGWLTERFEQLRQEQAEQEAARKAANERAQRTKQDRVSDDFSQRRKEAWAEAVLQGELDKLGGANQNNAIYKVTKKLICQLVYGASTHSELEIISEVEKASDNYIKTHSQKSFDATVRSAVSDASRMVPNVPDFCDHQPTNPPTYQPTNPPTHQPTNLPIHQPAFEDILTEAEDLLAHTTSNSRQMAKRELKSKARDWAAQAGDFDEAQIDELRDVLEELGLSLRDRQSWGKQVKEAQKKAKRERERREEEEKKREKEKVLVGKLPSVLIGHRQLREIADECMGHIEVRQQLYVYGESLAAIGRNSKQEEEIKVLDSNSFPLVLSRHMNFYKETKESFEAVIPPDYLIQALLNHDKTKVKHLKGLVTTPILIKNNDSYALDYQTGYLRSQFYNTNQTEIKESWLYPGEAEIFTARKTIDYILEEFPFISQSDKANCIAMMIQQLVRPAIDDICPLFVIDASTEGTGKTYLAQCVAALNNGANFNPLVPAPNNEEEFRKAITSFVTTGKPMMVFDNVEGFLKSSSLDRLITSRQWSDRVLGSSKVIEFPNELTLVLTANNVRLYKDTLSRSIFIKLDANMERPWLRTFKRDIRKDIIKNRQSYLSCLVTLICYWLDAGCPLKQQSIQTRFRAWEGLIGGILETAGIRGFCDNVSTQESEYMLAWKSFVIWWWETYADTPITASNLIGGASFHDGHEEEGKQILGGWLTDPTERGRINHLGKLLKSFASGRVFDGYKVDSTFRGYTTEYFLEDLQNREQKTEYEYKQEDLF